MSVAQVKINLIVNFHLISKQNFYLISKQNYTNSRNNNISTFL